MAVEHFDEGVYASNLWFDAASGGQYPARYFYAPPLVPAMIEASLLGEQMIVGPGTRPSNLTAMLPNLLAGCATLCIIWWMMRTWFDPVAAVGATTLAAGSEFHALYSRTALTDVMLVPWMLLAVFLFERAVAARRPRLLLFAGVACGLAWWTKYNGWLPLLITLGGLILRLMLLKPVWSVVRRDLAYWFGFVVVASIVWSPFLWSLQATGGYAPVMANHRGYLVGLSGWWDSFVDQWRNLNVFDGWISCLTPLVGFLLAMLLVRFLRTGQTETDSDGVSAPKSVRGLNVRVGIVSVCCLATLAVSDSATVAIAFLAMVGLVTFGWRKIGRAGNRFARGFVDWLSQSMSQSHDREQREHVDNGDLPLWMIMSWFAGLFVMTPLYSPYPRLTMTWLCASWLAGGLGIATLARFCEWNDTPDRFGVALRLGFNRFTLGIFVAFTVAAIFFATEDVTSRAVPTWQDRAGLRRAAKSIRETIDLETSLVFVQGEPGLYYQLRAVGVSAFPVFDPEMSLASLPDGFTAYLATGLHAQQSSEFQELLGVVQPRLDEVATIPYHPSDLVLLNNFRADELDTQRRTSWNVRLYRIK